jgi:hypothetical protein
LSVWDVSHTDQIDSKYASTSSRVDRRPVHGTRSSPGTFQSTVSADSSATGAGSNRASLPSSSWRMACVVSVAVVMRRTVSDELGKRHLFI